MADDKDSRMKQAVALEQKARQLEASGNAEDALREYKNCCQVFQFVHKYEQNPRVKEMLYDRLTELVGRAEKLKEKVEKGEVPMVKQAPQSPGAPGTATAAKPQSPSPGTDGSVGTDDVEDKEKAKMRAGLEGQILTEKPDIRWSDVAGLETAKATLQETVILPTRFPQLFTGKREPWHGILLYGPPGTGKSYLAKACATEVDGTFFSISSSDLVSKWMGESEKLVRSLFEMAREQRPSIIFIDEVDSLCGARGESGESDAARRIKTEFLTQMDGVGKSGSQLLVLGATNTPWDLDAAIRRRFEKRVYISLPDVSGRTKILKLNLGNTPNNIDQDDLAAVAERAEGYSGADIAILTRDALFEPVRRCHRALTFRQISRTGPDGKVVTGWTPCSPAAPGAVEKTLMEVKPEELLTPDVLIGDFEAALLRCRPSVCTDDLAQYDEWTKNFGMEG